MNFRRAEIKDKEILRKIAHDSEAYWGYDGMFMRIFDEKFNVSDHFLLKYPVFIGEVGECILCFWGAVPGEDGCELEYFYVSAEKIGDGWGKVMWNHFKVWCLEQGIKNVSFVTSPQAVGFYEKMGAVLDGVRPSLIDGRPIPHFIYQL